MNLPILLAVDFDMTLADSHPFPTIKGLRRGAKKYVNKLYDQGYDITIWTCRTDNATCSDATDAAAYLNAMGVKYHRFNANHPALNAAFGNDCRKIATDLYIDDKGLWPFGIPPWYILYWMIKWRALFIKGKKKILSHCKPEHFV